MRFFVLLVSLCLGYGAAAVDLVVEPRETLQQELELRGELDVFRDPALFLPQVAELYQDPSRKWEPLWHESPHLTTLSGVVCLRKLGPPTELRGFGHVARLYEVAEPRLRLQSVPGGKVISPLIVPVQLCGETRYKDTLGFVIAEDLERALRPNGPAAGMPPSTKGNPIPEWQPSPVASTDNRG